MKNAAYLIAELIAIAGMVSLASQLPEASILISLLSIFAVSIATFWAVVWIQHDETSLEPNYFLKLGPLGLITFISEIQKHWSGQPIWIGIHAIYKTLSTIAFGNIGTVAVAIAVAVAVAIIGADISSSAIPMTLFLLLLSL